MRLLGDLVIALVIFAAGFGAAWTWRGDRCEAKAGAVVASNAAAREQSTNQARATEAAQDDTSRRIDNDYQQRAALLAARPVPRRPGVLVGLRQPAARAPALDLPAPAQGASVPDAAAADPVSDRGCDGLGRDSQKTTLMLHQMQRWAREEGLAGD